MDLSCACLKKIMTVCKTVDYTDKNMHGYHYPKLMTRKYTYKAAGCLVEKR